VLAGVRPGRAATDNSEFDLSQSYASMNMLQLRDSFVRVS
jgi:hypothetical protein